MIARTIASSVVAPRAQRKQARVALRVRAEGEQAAEPAPWSPPKLNPDTPSPIFGGSTGKWTVIFAWPQIFSLFASRPQFSIGLVHFYRITHAEDGQRENHP